MTDFWCEYAWLGRPEPGVLVSVDDGVITAVRRAERPPAGAERLSGLVLPGMANAHSHAFHRALRGRTGGERGTFWTWRERMFELAGRLDPDTYYRLARAAYAEMALAGFTCVGEFHYVHHPPGGGRYDDPNAMGRALARAASDAGVRLTLLDTCYLSGGFGADVAGVQLRYDDGNAQNWAERVDQATVDIGGSEHVRVGAALHSVRAVPPDQMPEVADWARRSEAPLHVHLSEQPKENEDCLGAHGVTPTQLLHSRGVLGPRTTAVHATHLTDRDVRALGESGTGVCLCPTTEADLADGIGPAVELAAAGCSLSIGSDGQTVIDPLAEARAVESFARLDTGRRGHFGVGEQLAATTEGHRALGWPDAGRIEVGARGDLVSVALDGVRTAGVPPEAAASVATADDVRDVIVDGRRVVRDGAHREVPDVAGELRSVIADLLD